MREPAASRAQPLGSPHIVEPSRLPTGYTADDERPIPLPEALEEEIIRLMAEALVADLKRYPPSTDVPPTRPNRSGGRVVPIRDVRRAQTRAVGRPGRAGEGGNA